MNIGFDAKRAYHNTTGLGYYSRSLIEQMVALHPEHEYYLFNPRPSNGFFFKADHIHEIRPSTFPSTLFTSAWRSKWVTSDLKKLKIDLYHGLSHEIPMGIEKTGIRSVVTIHDLIHERFPAQYNKIDLKIYTHKYKNACRNADKIIAISAQTKQDIIDYYKTPAEKIEVCYQSCSNSFTEIATDAEKARIAIKYQLPGQFFLSVGTINERKNLLNVCKAIFLLRNDIDIPLVVVGRGSGTYYTQVKDLVLQQGLENKIIFLSEKPGSKTDSSWLCTDDLAVIYQQSMAMLYPSFFEGFGVPVLEALWSHTPVITSNVSSMPEIGGDAVYYVDPMSASEIAAAMKAIATNPGLADSLVQKGIIQAQKFTPEKHIESVMNVYRSLW